MNLTLMAALRILAFAAATGRVGSVFMIGDKLVDWHISNKAADSGVEAAGHAQALINHLTPDVVVTEDLGATSQKGGHTLSLLSAIARTAAHNHLLDVSVPRKQGFPNKYAEADVLVERYPELAPWKPEKRRFYDNEPRNTVLFEALSLALEMRGQG
jgi:hypothetical protein